MRRKGLLTNEIILSSVYLHGIHKRINRLEKDLCIPRREQHHFDYMSLKKPKEITIHGKLILIC